MYKEKVLGLVVVVVADVVKNFNLSSNHLFIHLLVTFININYRNINRTEIFLSIITYLLAFSSATYIQVLFEKKNTEKFYYTDIVTGRFFHVFHALKLWFCLHIAFALHFISN